jgi:hypothetical protein
MYQYCAGRGHIGISLSVVVCCATLRKIGEHAHNSDGCAGLSTEPIPAVEVGWPLNLGEVIESRVCEYIYIYMACWAEGSIVL